MVTYRDFNDRRSPADMAGGRLMGASPAGEKITGSNEKFRFQRGRALMFRTSLTLADAKGGEVRIGLESANAGIYFVKEAKTQNLHFRTVDDKDETGLDNVGVVQDGQAFSVEFYYDGGEKIACYFNGVGCGAVPLDSVSEDEDLSISISNDAAVNFVDVYQELRAVTEYDDTKPDPGTLKQVNDKTRKAEARAKK